MARSSAATSVQYGIVRSNATVHPPRSLSISRTPLSPPPTRQCAGDAAAAASGGVGEGGGEGLRLGLVAAGQRLGDGLTRSLGVARALGLSDGLGHSLSHGALVALGVGWERGQGVVEGRGRRRVAGVRVWHVGSRSGALIWGVCFCRAGLAWQGGGVRVRVRVRQGRTATHRQLRTSRDKTTATFTKGGRTNSVPPDGWKGGQVPFEYGHRSQLAVRYNTNTP